MIKSVLFVLTLLLNYCLLAQTTVTHLSQSLHTDSTKIFVKSMFYGQNLKPINNAPILTNVPELYWPSILLLFVFGIYVLIKITDPKKIIKVFMSVFSLQSSKQLQREDYRLYKRVSVFLSFCFVLVISFLMYKINGYFGLILKNYNPLIQYLFFIFTITAAYFIKIMATLAFSYITSSLEIGKEYIFNVFIFSQIMGIILFPIIVCLQFSKYPIEWFLYPGLIVCIAFYGLRMFRGFVLSALEQNVGFLYIILYFCALEILPLLVLVKFLLINF